MTGLLWQNLSIAWISFGGIMSKREELRHQRQVVERRNRILILSGIVLVAILVIVVIVNSQLKSKIHVVSITPNPRSQANGFSAGNPNAPVKVDIYSDFQCSACLHFYQNFEPLLMEQYVNTGKVFYTYHTYKVIGPESDNAAQAAYCANDQGKFWDYHDILYANWTGENVGDFTPSRLKAYAKNLGLDTTLFNQCYDSGKYRQKIADDQSAGDALSLSFTPSVFINGKLDESGNYQQTIDAALAGK
jgi:protein-disulfide isomerase